MDYKLYKKNSKQSLDMELFKNPTSEYRGTPFWSWNCKLDEDMLRRQIRALHEMGFGGFHMHSRTGMATPYLSKEFMDLVSACVDEAKKNDMLAWLYDEDRYSSGQAGGLALKDPRFRRRFLYMTAEKITDNVSFDKESAYISGGDYFVSAYDIALDSELYLVSYKRIGFEDDAENKKYYVYCKTPPNSGWFNNKCANDTMSKAAMDEFIRITYDAYKTTCFDEYGKTVPAMFTDEPQAESFLRFDINRKDTARCPWTYDFDKTYFEEYGYDLLDKLPELFIDLPRNKPSVTRYNFFNHAAERFSSAFLDNCADRCEKDGLLFTGHLMAEGSLEFSTRFVFDVMRPYRKMQLPGIDMLCNCMELDTAKQCQSVVRQNGREGMLSELYGVTNYDFDFRGHKFQGDWQAAMGVTVRVPHLAWVSMEGNAKRDYPATINYQAPWYKEYTLVENHFSRVNTVLTRGKALCNVAVIHPSESMWLEFGPDATSAGRRDKYDAGRGYMKLTEVLLFNHIDFDYICEALLPEQVGSIDRELSVGCSLYRTVIVNNCRTLRKTTVDILTAFAKAGGRVLFTGELPEYMNLTDAEELHELIALGEHIEFEKNNILDALECDRLVSMKTKSGERTAMKLFQLREDGDSRYLFVANADRRYCDILTASEDVYFEVKGEYAPILLDTMTGEEKKLSYTIKDGKTSFVYPFYQNTSILVKLEKSAVKSLNASTQDEKKPSYVIDFKRRVDYSLDNKNVLFLDRAEYSLDGAEFAPEEEILRLDNICRVKAGMGLRSNHSPQPWVVPEIKPTHFIDLRFTFESEIDYDGAILAIERPETETISFNGKSISPKPTGYFVDESIKTLDIGSIIKGKNILKVRLPLGERTNTEWCYILGDFGVNVFGCEKIVTELPSKLAFGSITTQLLPFYAHNVIYKTDFTLENDSDIDVTVKYYSAQVLRVFVDGKDYGNIAFSPYKAKVCGLTKGKHTLEIKAFGSLINSFGPIHYCGKNTWIGPDKWFTTGDNWTYEYNLHQVGVMASPEIYVFEK